MSVGRKVAEKRPKKAALRRFHCENVLLCSRIQVDGHPHIYVATYLQGNVAACSHDVLLD
jgi:hypothetical protein